MGLVVVLVVALLGGGYYFFFADKSPVLTYQGHSIDNASALLTNADAELSRTVTARHGVSASNSRCYFGVPKTPAVGAKKSDVADTLWCGPVLFVDGDPSQPYLTFGLASDPGTGKGVRLTARTTGQSTRATAVPSTVRLRRPDGSSPPAAAGRLQVPSPPPAENNFLGVGSTYKTTVADAPSTARMGAEHGGVSLVTLGQVTRYGQGDDARSAPAGQKLISFSLGNSPRADGSVGLPIDLDLHIVVDGSSRPLPTGGGPFSTGPFAVAVPDGVTSAVLQTQDSGITQSISLLDGKPGPQNLVVGQRIHHTETIGTTTQVSVRESQDGASNDRTANTDIESAGLFYWPPSAFTNRVLPSSPAKAFLSVSMHYSFTSPLSGETTADLGPYAYPAELLSLRLPDGRVVNARNIDSNPNKVYAVFEVPATFTTGTVVIGNSVTFSDGFTVSIITPVSVPIAIAAG